jgi:predicted small metal-binding protein
MHTKRVEAKMKTFGCKDIGMNCDWKVEAKTDEEIVREVKQHAQNAHNINTMSDELMKKIRSRIRESKSAA